MGYHNRLFTDQRTEAFADKIAAKSQERYGQAPIWARSDHVGPTGKPYQVRHLTIVKDGKVIAVARCNRAGAVHWHVPYDNECFRPEKG